jgi:hypothetical protein
MKISRFVPHPIRNVPRGRACWLGGGVVMKISPRGIASIVVLLVCSPASAQPATAPAGAPAAPKLRLGVKLIPTDEPGALVSEVVTGYAAETCGLKAGDRIVKVGDAVIDDVDSFRAAVAKLGQGAVLPFTVERDGQEQELTIRMTPPRADAPGANPPTFPALRDELLAMMEKDQGPRKILMEQDPTPEEREKLAAEMTEIDAANRERLKQVIEKHGYPTITMVGMDGAQAAFLIVQHGDADPQWQASMLPVFESLVKKGEVGRADFAYLTDRVLRAQNKPQRYATQYYQEPGPDGKPQFVPPVVEDPANLDKRRIEMGLGPWSVYEAEMAKMQQREPFPAVRGPEGK